MAPVNYLLKGLVMTQKEWITPIQDYQYAARILYYSRDWHRQQQRKHPAHPAVLAAMRHKRAVDWHQLVLEWPYVSDTDITRLAYTRDEPSGLADRQTITSVGKYLARHFPHLASHTVRDLVAKYATASTFSVSHEIEDIVEAAQDGPPSCMQWDEDVIEEHGHHPYETYAPKYGWGIAVRRDGSVINGRALVMEREGVSKYYVRTFNRHADDTRSYSQPDDQLDQWLQAQGYAHHCGWSGEKLAYIKTDKRRADTEFIAPYLDGDDQCVDVGWEDDIGKNNRAYLLICSEGEWKCTDTSGGAEQVDSCSCEACSRTIRRDDDQYSVGRYEDVTVCAGCIDDYTYVYGRNGDQYYIRNDDAVNVDNEMYDPDYLADNNIVTLHDGDYCHEDNAVYIETETEFYHIDDDDLVTDHDGMYQLESNCVELTDGEWALEGETWQCASSGENYLKSDDDPVEIRGYTFHCDVSAEDIARVLGEPAEPVSPLVWTPCTPSLGEAPPLPPLPAFTDMRDLRGNILGVHPAQVEFYASLGWTEIKETETA
jgi:hypothetical protein